MEKSKVITLTTPLQNADGTEITNITITSLKAKHLRSLPQGVFDGENKNAAVFVPVIASMSGYPESVIDEMDVGDLLTVVTTITDFLSVSLKTGET